ncbi:MAG: acylphosphatase [Bacteroidia bacterium]
MKKHLKIYIKGKVQGVYFRATAVDKAHLYSVYGFARNETDGTVYIEAEGDEESLQKFVEWCHIGPPLAVIEKVVIIEGDLKNYHNFITVRVI